MMGVFFTFLHSNWHNTVWQTHLLSNGTAFIVSFKTALHFFALRKQSRVFITLYMEPSGITLYEQSKYHEKQSFLCSIAD